MTISELPENRFDSFGDNSIANLLIKGRNEKFDQIRPTKATVSEAIRLLEAIIQDIGTNRSELADQSVWDFGYLLGEIKLLFTRFENNCPTAVTGEAITDNAKIYYAYFNIFEPIKLWKNSSNNELHTMFSGSIDNFTYQVEHNKAELIKKLVNHAKSTLSDHKQHAPK